MRRKYPVTLLEIRERMANQAACSNLPKVRVLKDWYEDEDGNICRQVGA
jgi:hypothetical protein